METRQISPFVHVLFPLNCLEHFQTKFSAKNLRKFLRIYLKLKKLLKKKQTKTKQNRKRLKILTFLHWEIPQVSPMSFFKCPPSTTLPPTSSVPILSCPTGLGGHGFENPLHQWHPQEESLKMRRAKRSMKSLLKGAKRYMKIILMIFSKNKIIVWGK